MNIENINPREMRKKMNEALRNHFVEKQPFQHSVVLLNAVKNAAYAQGLSGEDEMTMLAYYALQQYEDLWKRHLEFVNTSPITRVVLKK